jgi:hypothetical protein
VTPTSRSTVRLDELNDILAKLEAGGEAAQRLADLDSNRGTKGVLKTGREVGEPSVNTSSAVLSDADLAEQRLTQANKMEADAKSLLAEAKRLKDEAKSLTPKAKNVRATKKATA